MFVYRQSQCCNQSEAGFITASSALQLDWDALSFLLFLCSPSFLCFNKGYCSIRISKTWKLSGTSDQGRDSNSLSQDMCQVTALILLLYDWLSTFHWGSFCCSLLLVFQPWQESGGWHFHAQMGQGPSFPLRREKRTLGALGSKRKISLISAWEQ